MSIKEFVTFSGDSARFGSIPFPIACAKSFALLPRTLDFMGAGVYGTLIPLLLSTSSFYSTA